MVKTIAFIGIDGAGKTTVIEEVIKSLEKENLTCRRRYMGLGREYQLKFIESFIRRYRNFRKTRRKVSGRTMKSNYRERKFFWVAVQYLEIWARFIREKLRGGEIVLFDRYFYDGLILGDDRAFKFFRKFTPRPTRSFLIYADPKTIRGRKKEAEIKDIENFYRKVDKLKRYFDIEVIDNNKSLKSVVKKIKDEIKNV
jgi:thymidylate kinase